MATSMPEGGVVARRLAPWALALAAAVLATAMSWGAGELVSGRLDPGTLADRKRGPNGGPVDQAVVDRARVDEASITDAIQGAVLGLLLGLAGAASAGSARGATLGASAGLLLGGSAGGGAAFAAFWALIRSSQGVVAADPNDLLRPLLAHAAVWGSIGAGAGVGFGLGRRAGWAGVARAAIGGLAGAAIGAVLYEVVGALLFPNEKTSQPIALAWPPRLLAHAATNLLAALGAALLAAPTPTRPAGPAAPVERDSGHDPGPV